MRLCCADWFVPGTTYVEKCEFLKEVGIDGIEVFLDETRDLQLAEKDVRAGMKESGVCLQRNRHGQLVWCYH
jgi:hypothetical protein